jgi:hypothetical protein
MAWFRRRQLVPAIDQTQAELATLRAEVERLRALVANIPPPAVVTTPPPPAPGTSLANLDERITQVATELAHQLDELSGDLANLDTLRTAQERLAAEQVRYDLALRAEFAALADELRRRTR